ncbi:hypothetical protein ABFA07_013407 [Porites harrisoni]
MANYLRKFRLLIWKNFLLQKRRPIGTVFEILIPIVVMGILILIPLTADSAQDKCFSVYPSTQIDMYYGGGKLAFFPQTEIVSKLMARVENIMGLKAVSTSNTTGKPWSSGASMAAEVSENTQDYSFGDNYYGAIEFLIDDKKRLPREVKYAIRLRSEVYQPWHTDSTYPQYIPESPDSTQSKYEGKFLALQYAVDTAIMQMQTALSHRFHVKMQVFPYPNYTTNLAMNMVSLFMPLLVMLGLMYSAMTIIKELVLEKQSRLKESMKMMGLPNWVHWTAWFTKNLLFLLISVVIFVIVLKVVVFKYSDVTVLFVLFLLYIFASILFCFCVSVFFSRPVLGMLLGALIWIATLVPYFVVYSDRNYKAMTRSEKAGACLLPNTCLGLAAKLFAQFETIRVGISWKQVSEYPSPDENFNMVWVFCMLLAECAIFGTITWYVEAVFPGEYGIPKPFYFPCLPSYWCGVNGPKLKLPCDDEVTEQEEMNVILNSGSKSLVDDEDGKADVEDEPDLPVGVAIKRLRKVFEGSSGSKVAVDDLSLNIFKGQITALLGHNGAGKTTTISMLTGLFPPTTGSADVNGMSITSDMDAIRESLGLCPQHNVLFDRLTVKEHLDFFISLKGKFGVEADSEVNEMISDIQLVDKSNTVSSKLSGGMKRKLSCAIALIGGSETVFLDEPTSGMDPYARRGTWDLLLKHKAGRTIILTTHFMDEADLLGDRIAIMADGQLRCCGSSLFLKSRYGVGYHLTLVKRESCDQDVISNLVKSHVPKAEIISAVGTEIQFVLPGESSQNFEALFSKFENNLEQYGVTSFGVSVTTLEEVFMKVGEGAEKTLHDQVVDQKHRGEQVPGGASQIPIPESEASSVGEFNTGLSLKWQQYKAMLLKRFLNAKREKRLVLTQLILPLLMVCLALLLIKTLQEPMQNEPPRILNLSNLSIKGAPNIGFYADFRPGKKNALFDVASKHLKDVKVTLKDIKSDLQKIQSGNQGNNILVKGKKFQYKDDEKDVCCNYEFLVLNAKCKKAFTSGKLTAASCKNNKEFGYNHCPDCMKEGGSSSSSECTNIGIGDTKVNDSMTFYNEYVLEESNAADYFNTHVMGFSFESRDDNSTGDLESINATVWYSFKGYHTKPDALNALVNVLLAYSKKDDSYHIETINYPLPLNSKQRSENIWAVMSSFFLALLLAFAVAFLAASFVPFLVKEKSSKAKHLQFVSGVDAVSFWLATYSWDLINYLFPLLGIMILFAAFQVDSLKNDLGAVFLLLLLLGLCMLPFVYLISFLFKGPLAAYATTVFVLSVVSMAILITNNILTFNGKKDEGDIVHYIGLFFPTYSLSASIMDISQNNVNRKYCEPGLPCTSTKNVLDWDRPGVGQATLYMFVEAIVLFLFILLIEMNFFISAKVKISSEPQMNRKQGEDEDVFNERVRILSDQKGNAVQAEAVVLKDLTKVYRGTHVTAVDHLCLGIPRGECFGLLGINGAGKTTTFGMLTGDLSITEGTAYLDGFNIQSNLKQVQQRIGYCPQFDALIELLTGREMLTMYARLRGVPDEKIKGIVSDIVHLLRLEKWADSLCGNYSGGNRRKLSTAIALVGNPPIIFLDEPTTGMDPVARRFLWDTLTGVLKDGRSIVLTSHSMEECEALCTRLAIMVNGYFKCLGSTQHLKSRFGRGYTLMVKVGSHQPTVSLTGIADPEVNRVEVVPAFQSPHAVPSGQPQVFANPTAQLDNPDSAPDSNAVNRVMQFVTSAFGGATLMDSHSGILHYQIVNEALSWSYIFGQLERNRSALNIVDYSISQTTLEQVFINFAKEQHSEDRTSVKRKCMCFPCCR